MSKIKNVPRAGWFIAGVAITVVLVPSVAVAAGLKFTGIEGGVSHNKAEVATNGQLLTADAPPGSLFATSDIDLGFNTGVYVGAIYTPPADDAAIVTQIAVSPDLLSSGTTGLSNVVLYVGDSSCSTVGWQDDVYDMNQIFPDQVTLPSGVAIPSGDALCGHQGGGGMADATMSAAGYDVPASEVTAEPLHRVIPPKQG